MGFYFCGECFSYCHHYIFIIDKLCQLLPPRFKRWIVFAIPSTWVCATFCQFLFHLFQITWQTCSFLSQIFFNRLPFNWRTPFGYLIAQLSIAISYISILACLILTLCFYVSSCWLFATFAKDITNDLDLLNAFGASDRSHSKLQEHLSNIIQSHIDVKQLSSITYRLETNSFCLKYCHSLHAIWMHFMVRDGLSFQF